MKTSDFYYDLPEELIAQHPIDKRDASRLMHMDRENGEIEHLTFSDLPSLLKKGDCLVINDSRVLPARLIGNLQGGGAAEVLLLRQADEDLWECLVRPGKRLKLGKTVTFGEGKLTAEIVDIVSDGNRMVKFHYEGIFLEILEQLGQMPLPPYIKAHLDDPERYQTVYSRDYGSAAAPTAGLHFTKELLGKIESMGVEICPVTLHVGLGTFRPVKAEYIEEHEMHSEYCIITPETADKINKTRKNGGRIVCVGTTSCRTLEARANPDGTIEPFAGYVNIFIYPGYKFKIVDALVTNFHLPESTLVMLVSALGGRENILNAYKTAVEMKYRFFSFGDAMFIG
ncbi:MAG: tRNA preQ1(34) S-adenosylmethionine ribosyltransferase-isomerase QueA [Oscillospiraceae bacterium]|nr:tRNA preQ1(34) S-adenosylmethionine ribosyltransferase-isomerase QueA [Oscillospiraceae bacterium]